MISNKEKLFLTYNHDNFIRPMYKSNEQYQIVIHHRQVQCFKNKNRGTNRTEPIYVIQYALRRYLIFFYKD